MKRILLGLLLIVLILCGVFYRSLMETYEYYDFQKNNPEVIPLGTINWVTMSFTSTARIGSTNVPLKMEGLSVSVPFTAAVYEEGETYVHAYNKSNDDNSITAFTPEALDFFASYPEFTEDEQDAICRLLRRSSATQACDSPLNLYSALLKLNKSDVSLFTKSDEKLVFLKLMIVKATSLPSATISEFETEDFKGFLYHINDRNYAAHLFPNDSMLYPVNFNDTTEAEVAHILSNTIYEK